MHKQPLRKLIKTIVALGLTLVLGLLASPVWARGMNSMNTYLALLQKNLGRDRQVIYQSHVQKGDLILMQTREKRQSGHGGGDLHQLYIINVKTRQRCDIRSKDHLEPVFALGNDYFRALRIDSPTQLRFVFQSEKTCFDYQAIYNPTQKIYQPTVLKKYPC